MPFCEDPNCGEEVVRRTRCPNCKLLVCAWCFNHVHNLPHAVQSQEQVSETTEEGENQDEPNRNDQTE